MSATVYHYDEKALSTLALLFAPGFVHLGAQAWVDDLCKDLKPGKKVLDFGSAAGGAACQIAKKCDAQVVGLEFSKFLVTQSQELAAQENLTARVEFSVLPDTPPLILNQKFDLIFSIDTLSHCKNKDTLFTELRAALKTNGTLAIMDWFHKSPNYSAATEAFFKFTEGVFYLNTPQDYLQLLEKNKLSYVNFKDNTKQMCQYAEALITSLKIDHEGQIVAAFGAEYYEWWLEYWSLLYAALQSNDLVTGHVSGIKT
ncbi:MAG: methyltransferase domain-containing protein [Legionellales bacterium]